MIKYLKYIDENKNSINGDEHNIIIANEIENNVTKQVEKIKSDKKILFVYDNNIDLDIIYKIRDELKIFGADLILIKILGNKSNKNSNSFFRIIDVLISNNFTKNSILISCGGELLVIYLT